MSLVDALGAASIACMYVFLTFVLVVSLVSDWWE